MKDFLCTWKMLIGVEDFGKKVGKFCTTLKQNWFIITSVLRQQIQTSYYPCLIGKHAFILSVLLNFSLSIWVSQNRKENHMERISEEKNNVSQKIKRIIWVIVIVFIFLICGIAIYSIKPAINSYYAAKRIKENIVYIQTSAKNLNFKTAKKILTWTNDDLNILKSSIKKLVWLKFIPFVNTQYEAADGLIKTSDKLLSAAIVLTEEGEKILEPAQKDGVENFAGLSSEDKKEILKRFKESTPALEKASEKAKEAELESEKIPKKGVLNQLNEYCQLIKEYTPQIKSSLEYLDQASEVIPAIAGYPNEQTYLFLFQNNSELRPSGGFIGVYGISKVKDAEITEFWTEDSYALDSQANISVEPPWQIKTLVNPYIKTWSLRDANWSPDFAKSAQNVEWFYHEEGGKEMLSGTIGISPSFLEELLIVTGPIKVSAAGYDEEFRAETVVDELQYMVSKGYEVKGIEMKYRKDIVGLLAKEVIDKIYSLPKDSWNSLFYHIQKALTEKQLLFYFHDSQAQKFAEQMNWAGRVKETEDDFLETVDSNMASLKTDRYVKRSAKYEIDLTGNKAKVKLILHYKNEAPGFSWKTTRYRTWVRVYAPQGSTLASISGQELDSAFYYILDKPYEIKDELSKTSFGTFVSVEPGEEKDVIFEYYLPDALFEKIKKEKKYQLLAQKQPGVVGAILHLGILLPEKITSFTPSGGIISEDDRKIEYSFDFNEDKEVSIEFK